MAGPEKQHASNRKASKHPPVLTSVGSLEQRTRSPKISACRMYIVVASPSVKEAASVAMRVMVQCAAKRFVRGDRTKQSLGKEMGVISRVDGWLFCKNIPSDLMSSRSLLQHPKVPNNDDCKVEDADATDTNIFAGIQRVYERSCPITTYRDTASTW